MSGKPAWAQRLEQAVAERDEGLCINCKREAVNIHHIIPRRGKRWSRKIWREENMCCICHACHKDGQTVWMRVQLLKTMQRLYGYDMEWAKVEVVLEGA